MFKEIMNLLRRKQTQPQVHRRTILEEMFEQGKKARMAGLPAMYYRPITYTSPVAASIAAHKENAWREGWHHMDNVLARQSIQVSQK